MCQGATMKSPSSNSHTVFTNDIFLSPLTPAAFSTTTPENIPKMAQEIRFRVTTGTTLDYFATGSDLLLPNQLPWRIPLLRLASIHDKTVAFTRSSSHPLGHMLVKDGLVTPALMKRCQQLVQSTSLPAGLSRKFLIHSLGQLFHVNFRGSKVRVTVLGRKTVATFQISSPWRSSLYKTTSLYDGSALCCFEAHPPPSREGPKTVALRIVKITSPVIPLTSDEAKVVLMPIEGELAMRYTQNIPGDRGLLTTEPRPWTLCPSKAKHEVIQDLLRGATGKTS